MKPPQIDPQDVQPEILAKSITDCAEGARRLNNSRLTRLAVVVLLQHACGPSNITRKQIELVLDNAARLDKLYIKEKPKT